MRNMYYVDMHCHPAFKPYSWVLLNGKGSRHCRNVESSLWYNDPPKKRDRKLNRNWGLTRFRQSDFRTLTKGDVKIISACLSPIEIGLFMPRWPAKIFGFILIKTITEASFKFIRLVRKKNRDYFKELEAEYEYYRCEEREQQKGTFPTLFKLTNNYEEIEPDLKGPNKDTIYVFFSIEGCHVFNNGGLKNILEDKEAVKKNIQKVKKWKHPPLYVSIAHHLNNDLCGHAKSLPSILGWAVNQKKGMEEGFTDMGKEVLYELLNKDNGRIFIDIKHMNVKSRIEYYKILDTISDGKCIPVLVTHGAVNGRESIEGKDKEKNNSGAIEMYQSEGQLGFYDGDINIFDNEIIIMEKTGGFLGIQLDERRLCSAEQKKLGKRKKIRGEQLYHQAGLVWKQIRYIAEVLDEKGKFGWGTATIGSDYDGLVDPPNGYWTSDDFGILEENLIHHAVEYFSKFTKVKQPKNLPKQDEDPDQAMAYIQEFAQEVIDLFMRGNAQRFLKEFFCRDARFPENKEKDPTPEEAHMNE